MAHAQDTTHSNPAARGLAREFPLSTPAFADGSKIPKQHTADGENASPLLTWKDPPEGTTSFALVVEDPDAPNGLFVHWLAWNLPKTSRGLAEGYSTDEQLPDGVRQGRNGFGNIGYDGPSPPPGAAHRYVFRVFALDTKLELAPGAERRELDRAMEGHVLGEARLVGTYRRHDWNTEV